VGDISKSEAAALRTPSTQMGRIWRAHTQATVASRVWEPAAHLAVARSARNTNPRFRKIQGVSQ